MSASPTLGERATFVGDLLHSRSTNMAVAGRLCEHLEDWKQALRARGNTEAHVQLAAGRVRRILDGCRFEFPADIAAGRVQAFLHELRQGKDE